MVARGDRYFWTILALEVFMTYLVMRPIYEVYMKNNKWITIMLLSAIGLSAVQPRDARAGALGVTVAGVAERGDLVLLFLGATVATGLGGSYFLGKPGVGWKILGGVLLAGCVLDADDVKAPEELTQGLIEKFPFIEDRQIASDLALVIAQEAKNQLQNVPNGVRHEIRVPRERILKVLESSVLTNEEIGIVLKEIE